MSESCIVCGSSNFRMLFPARDFLYAKTVEAYLFQCCHCGLKFISPPPQDIAIYYPDDYGPYSDYFNYSPIAYNINRKGLKRRIEFVGQFQKGLLIDLGCAAGHFLAANPMNRLQVGADISYKALQLARHKHHLNVWLGDNLHLPLADSTVSIVTLWHVFEHIAKPIMALQEISRVLRSDGTLIIAIPVTDSLEARLFGQYWAGYDMPRHLFSYSRSNFRKLLESAGFEVEEAAHIILGINSTIISTTFWLKNCTFLQKRRRMLRMLSIIIGVVLGIGFHGLSYLTHYKESVGVFIASPSR